TEIPGLAQGLTGTIKYPTKATIWCDTLGTRVLGPLTDQEWTALLARDGPPLPGNVNKSGKRQMYWRMAGRGICIYPGPGNQVLNFRLDAMLREPIIPQTLDYRELFERDDDMCLLPGRVV